MSCVDHIIIFHVQISRRLRFAHPLSVKEKEGCAHFKPLTRTVCLHQFLQSGRLFYLETNKAAILALENEMDIRVGAPNNSSGIDVNTRV